MAPKVPQLRLKHLDFSEKERAELLRLAGELHASGNLFTDELSLLGEEPEDSEIAIMEATGEYEEHEHEEDGVETMELEMGEPPVDCEDLCPEKFHQEAQDDAVGAANEPTAVARMSRFLALKLVCGAPSPSTLKRVAEGDLEDQPKRARA